MSIQIEGVPFNRVLSFPLRDAQAVKRSLAAAGLFLACFVIPLLPGFLVGGYSVRLLRRTIRQGEVEMPEWSDASALLLDGVRAALIGLVYLLPGLLTLLAGIALYFFSFFLIIPAMENQESFSVLMVFLPMTFLFIGIALGMILLFVGAVPYPVALCRFADEGRLGAAFQLGKIFQELRRNPIGYLGAWIVAFGFCYVLYFVYFIAYLTVILCCPGYILFSAGSLFAGFVFLAMTGLAYREGKAIRSEAEQGAAPR